MPDDRLPTREQITSLQQPDAPSTCVLCWQEKDEPLENGVCSTCRYGLGRRGVELVAENARLKQERDIWTEAHAVGLEEIERLREAAMAANQAMRDYNRNGITWLELDRTFAHLEAVLRG